ncbi:aminotransferase class iii [Holotrichia oblita]|nr:aminotransferase class iii [Holotrichia oblita]
MDLSKDEIIERANIIVEALPYFSRYSGKIVVIKYGGNAMNDPAILKTILEDVAALKIVGVHPILVHGGGPEINSMLERLDIKSEFVNGLRVTTKETMEIVQMVLSGKINKNLTATLNTLGVKAVGICGKDSNLIEVTKMPPKNGVDYGYVGQITNINKEFLLSLVHDYIPVIATVGVDKNGEAYNINADIAAGAIGGAVGAERLMYLTDIDGIRTNEKDPSTLISQITVSEINDMIDDGRISGGMIPKNVCFVRGDKNKLYDTQDKEYTDFLSGIAVNCLGYNHPELNNAIIDQCQKLMHTSNLFYNVPQVQLCEKLLEGTVFERMMLTNSGAEANEVAIKLIRKYYYNKGEHNKYTIVCAQKSFHGRTMATLTATGQEKYSKPYAPLLQGFTHVPLNDLDALKNALTPDVGALFLECIQGEAGVIQASYDYLINAYALCKSKDILFVLDEVQTGMGRTGKMFCFEHYGIRPDIITLAKGLGAGFPIGAMLARGEIAEAFKPGDHGTTFGGNPLACAAALCVVKLLKDTDLLNSVTYNGNYLNARLSKFRKHNFVSDVRGLGLLQGVELSEKLKASEVAGKMLHKGFIINAAGSNTLRFAPPYTITKDEIDSMADALSEIFASLNI